MTVRAETLRASSTLCHGCGRMIYKGTDTWVSEGLRYHVPCGRAKYRKHAPPEATSPATEDAQTTPILGGGWVGDEEGA
jgi:hypothetical protein